MNTSKQNNLFGPWLMTEWHLGELSLSTTPEIVKSEVGNTVHTLPVSAKSGIGNTAQSPPEFEFWDR